MSKRFIIDGVCHPYNFSPGNLKGDFGRAFADVLYSYHPVVNPPGVALERHEWDYEWGPEEFMETMILESDVDMVSMHSLPIYDAFKDGGAGADKGAALKRDYPQRVLWYAGVDMFEPDKALADAKRFIDQGADGIKFYPSRYVDGFTESWRMDDERSVFPVLQAAYDAGIRNVAIHKVLPIGPVSSDGMQVDDISAAANAFPDMNFQIVHAGFMFVDETKMLMGNHPNIFANMEASLLLAMLQPRRMADILDEFLIYGGPDRLIFSSAAVNPHPQIVIDGLERFELPDTSPIPLSSEVRDLLMGGNLARLHGIDIEKKRAELAQDSFAAEKQKGLRAPFSSVRAKQKAAA